MARRRSGDGTAAALRRGKGVGKGHNSGRTLTEDEWLEYFDSLDEKRRAAAEVAARYRGECGKIYEELATVSGFSQKLIKAKYQDHVAEQRRLKRFDDFDAAQKAAWKTLSEQMGDTPLGAYAASKAAEEGEGDAGGEGEVQDEMENTLDKAEA